MVSLSSRRYLACTATYPRVHCATSHQTYLDVYSHQDCSSAKLLSPAQIILYILGGGGICVVSLKFSKITFSTTKKTDGDRRTCRTDERNLGGIGDQFNKVTGRRTRQVSESADMTGALKGMQSQVPNLPVHSDLVDFTGTKAGGCASYLDDRQAD